MKQLFVFLLSGLMSSTAFAQVFQPEVLHEDTPFTTPAGFWVDRGDEYQLITLKNGLGLISIQMDTLFQILSETPSFQSFTMENVLPLADGQVIVSGFSLDTTIQSRVGAIQLGGVNGVVWQAFSGFYALGNGFGRAIQGNEGDLLLIGRNRIPQYGYSLTLTRIDSLGTYLSDREYLIDRLVFGTDLIQRPNGNLLFGGIVSPADTISPAGFLLETNSQGDSLRSLVFGDRYNYVHRLIPSGDGVIVVGQGGYQQYGKPASLKLWRWDENLQLAWESSFRFTDSLGAEHDLRSIRANPTKDGGCVVLAATSETAPNGLEYPVMYVGKFSWQGEQQWDMTVGPGSDPNRLAYSRPVDILPLAQGGYLISAIVSEFTENGGPLANYTYFARLSDDGTPELNVSRELELASLAVEIHPNPFTTEVRGELLLHRPNQVTIALYDLQGRQLTTHIFAGQAGSNAFHLPTQHLPPASYVLRVSSPEGQWSQIIVKQ
ncbi:MAG: T9SS type A sorting domain-containing protein [Bacteroidota bacterium]